MRNTNLYAARFYTFLLAINVGFYLRANGFRIGKISI